MNVITVEGAVYAAIFVASPRPAIWVIAAVGLVVAWLGMLTMRRHQISALVDGGYLNLFEQRLSDGDTDDLPLQQHQTRLPERVQWLAGHRIGGKTPRIFYIGPGPHRLSHLLQRLDEFFATRFSSAEVWLGILPLIGVAAPVFALFSATRALH